MCLKQKEHGQRRGGGGYLSIVKSQTRKVSESFCQDCQRLVIGCVVSPDSQALEALQGGKTHEVLLRGPYQAGAVQTVYHRKAGHLRSALPQIQKADFNSGKGLEERSRVLYRWSSRRVPLPRFLSPLYSVENNKNSIGRSPNCVDTIAT
jgi:hypothetical protein